VDSKYHFYKDNVSDEEFMIEAPTFEHSLDQDHSGQNYKDVYQNKILNFVKSYYEEKYSDLDKKRIE
jgi:hypothetical protein